jgi:phosphoribosylformylglycinamidine cyclo-ligase
MYQDGDYDLAGFCVGVAEEAQILDGSDVQTGHIIIGLPSSGPHSNGYSLIRKIIARADVDPSTEQLTPELTVLDAVMKPTRIYVKPVLKAMATGHVTGAVHITGGGFQENLPRSFNHDLAASIDLDAWDRPEIFKWLEAQGDVGAEEMLRTFNCGIGFIMFCAPEHVDELTQILADAGEHPIVIGQLTNRTTDAVVFTGAFA